ncbi:MAG: hydrogenase maturation protein [Rubrivivax sp.]|nr:hydrogenase maturation protein [Rubrivivax sp.]
MKILLLTHAFNGLAQRLWLVLREAGHAVSVELDIADSVTEEAVARFDPDVVLAPFLKRRIPESVWSTRLCLVLHPGPPGDRGPSALDWALLEGKAQWGVTVLQATADFDAGPVWAAEGLEIPEACSKAELYRQQVTPAAVRAVLAALARVQPGSDVPRPMPQASTASQQTEGGGWRPLVTQAQRAIDWSLHSTAQLLARVRSADSAPGAVALLLGENCRLHDLHEATPQELARVQAMAGKQPGQALARRGPALLLRTRDGAVWVGHVRRAPQADGTPSLKLAATRAWAEAAASLPEWPVPLQREDGAWDELHYRELGPPGARVGWLDFDFFNGALSERQAGRLQQALSELAARDTQVLVLAGGRDFFCNGIHLHEIEACAHDAGDSAADASWRHINAIDDVALQILQTTDRLVISALRGNAGAGGCFLALAADQVWLREAVVLNPHYKNMGNLYGSEYWTYLLPQRVGTARSREIMQGRLPMSASQALTLGLADAVFGPSQAAFESECLARALALAAAPDHAARVQHKRARRAADEAHKPLAAYRAEELTRMRRNFYGFDPSYHVARHHFVHRKPHAWTPRHLALHR